MSEFADMLLNNSAFAAFSQWLVLTTISSAGLALLVSAICLTCRRWLSPRFRHTLWLLVVVRMLLPFAPESRWSLGQVWQDALNGQSREPAPPDRGFSGRSPTFVAASPDHAYADAPTSELSEMPAQTLSLSEFLVALCLLAWPVGFVGTAAWTLWSSWNCRRLLSRLDPTDDRRLLDILRACQTELAIGRKVQLLIVPRLASPAQRGLFRPQVLLPADVARNFSDEELRQIVLHELAHVRRRDVAVNGVLAIARVLYWWNPIYWLVQNRLGTERELACDALVLKTIGATHSSAYGRTVLRIVERLNETAGESWNHPPLMPGLIHFLGRASALKGRLRALRKNASTEGRLARIVGCAVSGLVAFAGLTDAKSPVASDEPPIPVRYDVAKDAVWRVAAEVDAPGSATSTICFEGADVLDRLMDERNCTRDRAREMIAEMLRDWQDARINRVTCSWSNDQLVCRAPMQSLQNVGELLSLWKESGFPSICIDLRTIDLPSDLDLVAQLDIPGGELISSVRHDDREPHLSWRGRRVPGQASDSQLLGNATATIERRLPMYLKKLDARGRKRVVDFAQNHSRVNLLFAPKVTLCQGQEAFMFDHVSRPFVVGLRSVGDDVFEPQVEIIPEGLSMRFRAIADAATGKIHLDCEFLRSAITDVAVTTVGRGANREARSVQIPTVKQTNCRVTAEMKSGESLLLHPMGDAGDQRRAYFLVTPEIVAPRTAE